MKIYYGDLHGVYSLLPHIRGMHAEADEIIFVGDFGYGFPGPQDKWVVNYGHNLEGNPTFATSRGNHDNPYTIRNLTDLTDGKIRYIEDGTIEDGTLYIGGAYSLDKQYRIPGFDWWAGEELTDAWWDKFLSELDGGSIHTVVTHDCPNVILPFFGYKNVLKTNTGGWLDILLTNLPNVNNWIFGHHHKNMTLPLDGVIFHCLADGTHGAVKFEDGKVERV